jgi:hypothetical protein
MEAALEPVPTDALTLLLTASDTPFSEGEIDPELELFVTLMLAGPAIPVARFGSAI